MSDLKKLKGKTIQNVEVDGVNSVRLSTADGNVYVLDTIMGISGIPVLQLTKEKAVGRKLKSKGEMVPGVKMGKDAAWPFPTGQDAADEKPVHPAWPFPLKNGNK